MHARKKWATVAAVAAGIFMVTGTASAATNTVTVNETSLGNGWTLYIDNGGSGAFINGPATPPAGTGSFEFDVPYDTNAPTVYAKVNLSTNTVQGDLLANVDEVAYSTYRDSTSTMPGNVDPSLNMEICAGGIDATLANPCVGYTTLVWEPVYAYGTTANANNPVVTDKWQTWNALDHTSTSYAGGWWSTHTLNGSTLGGTGTVYGAVDSANPTYTSLATIQAVAPNAVILSFGVNMGHGPAGTFYGNADALTLGISGTTTVWDFEHAVTLLGKDECMDGGWMTSTNPTFVNQGDCVSYFASGGKTHSHA